MIDRERFASASGLRPMSAFVVIATVVFLVAGKVVLLSARRPALQPDLTQREEGQPVPYVITDASGQTLARCVPRFDLVMSPRSMWQAHTPDHMAEQISDALGGEPSAEELLAAMLPDAQDGSIEVDCWDLSVRQAYLLEQWIESGAGCGSERLAGIWVERQAGAPPRYRLVWKPAILFSKGERARHGYASAWAWARRIAVDLAKIVEPGAPADTLPADSITRAELLDERCKDIWKGLLPRGYCRPVRGVDSDRVLLLRRLLKKEGVSPWQMRIAYEADRAYPSGTHELFGSWGFTRPEQTEAGPRNGLELMSQRLLASAPFSEMRSAPPVYTWQQDRSVRGQRASGYVSFQPCTDAPVVESTLELDLLAHLRRELEEVMEVHEPALAMGIVLDLESAEVLAVDSIEAYEVQPFAPVYHLFTPGSTFKVLTMAIALEEGVVRPETSFEVGDGAFRLVDPADGRARTIHEAEGSLHGTISAAQALAYSVNAGLAQIGLRVPAPVFREYLAALGYGRTAGSGLGIEKAGHLRALPWKYRFTHASVGFGHELSTTLWQHAAALATVLRGGEHKELRLLRSVHHQGATHAVDAAPAQRIFSARTCREVREMMAMGACEGTGEHCSERLLQAAAECGLAGFDREAFALGTKTGTAQQVSTEICKHVELSERERCREQGLEFTRERYAALRSMERPHRGCYTSSMCAVARRPSDGREIMVLVVVDEPRGREKFGSKVAGPAAIDVLAEALRLTRVGRAPRPELVGGFGLSEREQRNVHLEPWREPYREAVR